MTPEPARQRTFVLIPGAGGQAWYWHLVVPLLDAAGHRTIAVELPAGDQAAGIGEYVDVVLDAVGDASSGDLVVVGQSLGAFTAVGVCTRTKARHLVLLNPMIPAPGETAGEWWANTDQSTAMRRSDEAAGRDPDAEFDERAVFFHDVPDDLIAEAYAGEEPVETEASFATPSLFEGWPHVPTTVVVGRDDRLFPVEFQRRVARERIGVDPVEIPGGHLNSLSQPEALAAALLKASEA